MDAQRLAAVGSALGSESRAAIVCTLMSGTAHTGIELARHLRLSRSTVSEHLAVLQDAGIIEAESQGRHRYVRLAGPHVAHQLEQLLTAFPGVTPHPRPSLPADLAFARSCYDHVAGRLGVGIYERMLEREIVTDGETSAPAVTPGGREWYDRLGIPLPSPSSRPAARACLDWSERRSHLAGPAAAALMGHMLDHGWVRRHRSMPRVLVLTAAGRDRLGTHLDLEIP